MGDFEAGACMASSDVRVIPVCLGVAFGPVVTAGDSCDSVLAAFAHRSCKAPARGRDARNWTVEPLDSRSFGGARRGQSHPPTIMAEALVERGCADHVERENPDHGRPWLSAYPLGFFLAIGLRAFVDDDEHRGPAILLRDARAFPHPENCRSDADAYGLVLGGGRSDTDARMVEPPIRRSGPSGLDRCGVRNLPARSCDGCLAASTKGTKRSDELFKLNSQILLEAVARRGEQFVGHEVTPSSDLADECWPMTPWLPSARFPGSSQRELGQRCGVVEW